MRIVTNEEKLRNCRICGGKPITKFIKKKNAEFRVLCCAECGYIAAKPGELTKTIEGSHYIWNKNNREE